MISHNHSYVCNLQDDSESRDEILSQAQCRSLHLMNVLSDIEKQKAAIIKVCYKQDTFNIVWNYTDVNIISICVEPCWL